MEDSSPADEELRYEGIRYHQSILPNNTSFNVLAFVVSFFVTNYEGHLLLVHPVIVVVQAPEAVGNLYFILILLYCFTIPLR
jgi:hypothetical protein